MPGVLYFDTARLGLMSPRAHRASVEFARFAGEYGASPYLCDFLRGGCDALPDSIRRTLTGLSDWLGVTKLKQSFRALTSSRQDAEVLLAARSAVLMRFAARLLVRPCRNVMLTDLTWPVYERILRRELPTSACTVTRVSVRQGIIDQQFDVQGLVEKVAREFVQNRCDGLFLPLIDNFGIRFPVQRLVERIQSEAELRFVVADAAQAIHHVPLDLATDYCDFVVAGCHKWLRAFTPMGVGVFGHPRSREYIASALARWTRNGIIDDPLLGYVQELVNGEDNPFGETVSLSALMTSNGAAVDALQADSNLDAGICDVNRATVAEAARNAGWTILSPDVDFASRIMLLRSDDDGTRREPAEDLRRRFLEHRVSLTAYESGVVRISLPAEQFSNDDRDILTAALVKT